jgi:hypothetical protein
MIGSIVIGVWVLLGLLNIFLWREDLEDETEDITIVSPEFFKKFAYVVMLIFAPYYFYHGVERQIKFYLAYWAMKKIMYKFWRQMGLDPKLEWKKHLKRVKEKVDKDEDN